MSNVDVNGMARGTCTECDCEGFLRGDKVRCAFCDHVPNKHSPLISSTTTSSTKLETQSNPFSPPPPGKESSQEQIPDDDDDSFWTSSPELDSQLKFSSDQGCDYLTNAILAPETVPFPANTTSSARSPPRPAPTAHAWQTPAPAARPPREDDSHKDARGVARGGCIDGECNCKRYKRPPSGSRCTTCEHAPTKHTNFSSQDSPQHTPKHARNIQNVSKSIVSAKVNLSPLSSSSQTGSTSGSHQVTTSFRSDPPNCVTVAADNSLVVPANQAVKITIEVNIVPKSD